MGCLLAFSSLQEVGAETEGATSLPAKKHTAGLHLKTAWAQARGKYPDALFLSASGRTDASGAVLCNPEISFEDGWVFTFYSPKAAEFLVVTECAGRLVGPLRQMVAQVSDASKLSVEGRFIDSDYALELLGKSGVSMDPRVHYAGGKRPFQMILSRLEDERFQGRPVVWNIRIGKSSFFVDAVRKEMLSTSTQAAPGAPLALRPKRSKLYTASVDLDKALRFAEAKFPDARLMAVEGLVDAWGSASCMGAGDGWIYYFYYPRIREFDAIYSCDGSVSIGPIRYLPVDFGVHQPFSSPFMDSNQVLDTILKENPSAMDEGMGRRYTRNGTLRLLNYRISPFASTQHWKSTLIWHLELGSTIYRLDAQQGILIDVSE